MHINCLPYYSNLTITYGRVGWTSRYATPHHLSGFIYCWLWIEVKSQSIIWLVMVNKHFNNISDCKLAIGSRKLFKNCKISRKKNISCSFGLCWRKCIPMALMYRFQRKDQRTLSRTLLFGDGDPTNTKKRGFFFFLANDFQNCTSRESTRKGVSKWLI